MAMWPGMHRCSFLRDHVAIGDSPWDVERRGTKRVRASWPHDIYVIDFGGWCNMMRRGKPLVRPQNLRLLKELNIDL